MRWRNSAERYGAVAMALHWLIAIAIVGMIALGLVMVETRTGSPMQFQLYQLHKSIGITILALSLARLAWRLTNPVPPLPASLRPWEAVLARVTHLGFYGLMIALPLSGWIMVSVSPWNIPTVLYGLIPLPHLPGVEVLGPKKAAETLMKEVHEVLAWGIIALLVLHVAGALKHHFLLGDDVLVRMLPRFRAQTAEDKTGSGTQATLSEWRR